MPNRVLSLGGTFGGGKMVVDILLGNSYVG